MIKLFSMEDVSRAEARARVSGAAIETPDLRARAWGPVFGAAPVLAVLLLLAGLLWGLGEELPLVEDVAGGPDGTSGREAVAWLSAAVLVAIIAGFAVPWAAGLLRGEWRGTLIGGPWREKAEQQRDHVRAILAQIESEQSQKPLGADDNGETAPSERIDPQAILVSTLSLTFPIEAPVRATSLGNVLAAVGDRVFRRYDLDLRVAWSRLFAVLPTEEQASIAALERRRDSVVALASGSLLATLVALAAAAPYLGRVQLTLLAPAAFLVLARRTYRSAVELAIEHGRAVEAAVDVHVAAFLEAMGMGWPPDRASQRERCRQLSERLALPESVTAAYGAAVPEGTTLNRAVLGSVERSVGDAVSRTLDEGLERRLSSAVEGALPRAVEETLPAAVNQIVLPAVTQGVERAIAGPPLTNYSGWVSVELTGPDEQPLTIHDEHESTFGRSGLHGLHVSIGAQPGEGLPVPLRVSGGEDRNVVTFDVVVDSDQRALRRPPQTVIVAAEGATERVVFDLELDTKRDDDSWIWVRVLQRRRLIQTIDLHLTTDGKG